MLSLKEFNLESFIYKAWRPFKKTGRKLNFIRIKRVLVFFIPAYLLGMFCLYNKENLPPQFINYIPAFFSFLGFVMVLKSYSERKNVKMSWMLIVMNHFWIILAIAFSKGFKLDQAILYLSGIVFFGSIGYFSLHWLKKREKKLDLNGFQGHIYEYRKIALVFLICCLGITGFPISPTFIGEDLVFIHIEHHQYALAFFVAASFIIDGISAIRIYARIFLGPHIKTYHETAFKSS